MEEIWKQCVRKKDYEVSNLGRIRNKAKKIIESKPNIAGYIRIFLGSFGTVSAHILIAETFIPKTDPSKTLVNHIDGIRNNNCVTNLEWVTPKENANKKVFPCLKPKRPTKDDLEGEEWKDFTFNEDNKIKVSNFGRICTIFGSKTAGSKGADGYMRIVFKKAKASILVHRIICAAFHGPPLTRDLVVNHKDGNRQNNKPENLEWVTQRENIIHSVPLRIGKPAHNKRKVNQYTIEGEFLKTFCSVQEAAHQTNTNRSRIQQFLNPNNKSKHACGFTWK